MDMDLLIELAVRAVKAYLEKEGITSAVQACDARSRSIPPRTRPDPDNARHRKKEALCE